MTKAIGRKQAKSILREAGEAKGVLDLDELYTQARRVSGKLEIAIANAEKNWGMGDVLALKRMSATLDEDMNKIGTKSDILIDKLIAWMSGVERIADSYIPKVEITINLSVADNVNNDVVEANKANMEREIKNHIMRNGGLMAEAYDVHLTLEGEDNLRMNIRGRGKVVGRLHPSDLRVQQ